MASDFTLEKYADLCRVIAPIQTDCRYVHYLEDTNISKVILRHDVDRRPLNALRMAKLEHDIGLRTTYFFRCVPCSFDPDIIVQISRMGHEIGYHYEAMSKARGDPEKARAIFKEDMESLRSISEIRTVCMHGSPSSRYNNLSFWEHANLSDYDLKGEAYTDLNPNLIYYTDTGGKWNNGNNIRDRVHNCFMPKVGSTQDVESAIGTGVRAYINCHPERWANDRFEWFRYRMNDQISNKAKILIVRCRGKQADRKEME